MNKIIPTKLSHIVEIPKIEDEGYLCFMEKDSQISFDIKRVYFIYDAINNAVRGKHAHKKTKQILFCIKGSITIILDNGSEKETIRLDETNKGIYLDAMMWHEMVEFTKDTVLLVLASEKFDENDYIRDHHTYLAKKNGYFNNLFKMLMSKFILRNLALLFRKLI